MVKEFSELIQGQQVLLTLCASYQMWLDEHIYLQELSSEGLHQQGVSWFCAHDRFGYSVLRPSGRPFVSIYFTVEGGGSKFALMVQNYSHGKLLDTKVVEGRDFSIADFDVLFRVIPEVAYVPILRSLPFFFSLIGLESQFQGYQHRLAVLNEWIEG